MWVHHGPGQSAFKVTDTQAAASGNNTCNRSRAAASHARAFARMLPKPGTHMHSTFRCAAHRSNHPFTCKCARAMDNATCHSHVSVAAADLATADVKSSRRFFCACSSAWDVPPPMSGHVMASNGSSSPKDSGRLSSSSRQQRTSSSVGPLGTTPVARLRLVAGAILQELVVLG